MATGGLKAFRSHNVSNDRTAGLGEMCNNVSFSNLKTGHVLVYDASQSRWENGPVAGGPSPAISFLDLTDTPNTYTNALSLIQVNAAKTGLREVDCQVSLPGANQFKLTSGTTDLTCTADCDINQNLSTTSTPTFSTMTTTGSTYVHTTGVTNLTDAYVYSFAGTAGGFYREYAIGTSYTAPYETHFILKDVTGSRYLLDVSDGGAYDGMLRALIGVNTVKLNFGSSETTYANSIKDEDNMASDSVTALCTQQSIKAYVDSKASTSGTFDITFTGIWAADRTVTCAYTKIGNLVTCRIPDCYAAATASSSIASTATIPAALVPTATQSVCSRIYDNTVSQWGSMSISTVSGKMYFTTASGASFQASGTGGILAHAVSWILN